MSNWKQAQLAARERNRRSKRGYKLFRGGAHMESTVGPYCPWPRDSRDGTCIWPGQGAGGPKPPEWWKAFWETLPPEQRPRPGSFLEGYSPRVGPFNNGTLS